MPEKHRRVELVPESKTDDEKEREREQAKIDEKVKKRKRAENVARKCKREEDIARAQAQLNGYKRIKKVVEAEGGGYDLLNEDFGLSRIEESIKKYKKELRKLNKNGY